jgi:hypothetical protein
MDSGTIGLIIFIGFFAIIIIWGLALSIYNKSRGTISVVLDKYQFMRGEKVTGKVVVNLKKVIHAQKLSVSVVATKQITERQVNLVRTPANNPGGMPQQDRTNNITLFEFELPLDGEKDYLQAEYTFEITIPQDAAMSGSGNLSPMGAMIGGMGPNLQINPNIPVEIVNSQISWNVNGHLYIPGKPDLSGVAQINVT